MCGRILLNGKYTIQAQITSGSGAIETVKETMTTIEMKTDPNQVCSFGVDYSGIALDIQARNDLVNRDKEGKVDWGDRSVWFLDSSTITIRDFSWIERKSIAIGFHNLSHLDITQAIKTRYISGSVSLENIYDDFYQSKFSLFSYQGHRVPHAPLGGAMMLSKTDERVFPSCSTIIKGQDCIFTGESYKMACLNFKCKNEILDYDIKNIVLPGEGIKKDTIKYPLEHVRLAIALTCSSIVGLEPSLGRQLINAGVDCVIGTRHKVEHVFGTFFYVKLLEQFNKSSNILLIDAVEQAFNQTKESMKAFLKFDDQQLNTYISDGFDGDWETTIGIISSIPLAAYEDIRRTSIYPLRWGAKSVKE